MDDAPNERRTKDFWFEAYADEYALDDTELAGAAKDFSAMLAAERLDEVLTLSKRMGFTSHALGRGCNLPTCQSTACKRVAELQRETEDTNA